MRIRQSPSQQPSSVVFDAQTCERYSPHILGWICWPRHPKRRRLHLQELNAGSKICFNAFNPRVQRSENHRGPMRNRKGSRCLCSKDISKRSWGWGSSPIASTNAGGAEVYQRQRPSTTRSKSCFMNMIDYYLLEAEVSFCVYKNSCHVVWKFAMCPFWLQLVKWHSYTSDTHCLWNNAQVSFHPLDVVTCFLLFGGLVFLFTFTTPFRGFIACGRSNGWAGAAKDGWSKEDW